MGHGDRIVLADAFFPAYRLGPAVIEMAGVQINDLLRAIFPLFVLDQYVPEPLTMMQAVPGDQLDPTVPDAYAEIARKYEPDRARIRYIDRQDFYDEASEAFAIVLTSTTTKYANLLLAKGVTEVGT